MAMQLNEMNIEEIIELLNSKPERLEELAIGVDQIANRLKEFEEIMENRSDEVSNKTDDLRRRGETADRIFYLRQLRVKTWSAMNFILNIEDQTDIIGENRQRALLLKAEAFKKIGDVQIFVGECCDKTIGSNEDELDKEEMAVNEHSQFLSGVAVEYREKRKILQ